MSDGASGGPCRARVASDSRQQLRAAVPTLGEVDIELEHDPMTTPELRGSTVMLMAIGAAVGTSAIYPLQPAIADVASSMELSTASVGTALACGPAGYLIGLGVLVPLVDRFAPRNVVGCQFIALGVAVALSAVAPNAWLLGLGVFLSGVCSSVGAGLSSIAGRFADAGRRATVLGMVTAGISVGILAGRILGGWLTDHVGWRAMLLVFTAACLGAASVALVMPEDKGGRPPQGYLETLRSMPGLLLRMSDLRLAALRGAAWFFAFCAVWAGLAVALSEPPHDYSAERIGLLALAGLSGVGATRVAGTLTDRHGARVVMLWGLAAAGGAAAVLGFALSHPALVLVCLALFDAGLFAAQVANQSTVLDIAPEAPARFNSAYMIVYFVGGSLGTAFGTASVSWLGWSGSVAVAVTAIAAAALMSYPTSSRSLTHSNHRGHS